MNPSLITFEDLKTFYGFKEDAKPHQVTACLLKNNVPFQKGNNGRPVTTVEALNYAMGISNNSDFSDEETIVVLD